MDPNPDFLPIRTWKKIRSGSEPKDSDPKHCMSSASLMATFWLDLNVKLKYRKKELTVHNFKIQVLPYEPGTVRQVQLNNKMKVTLNTNN